MLKQTHTYLAVNDFKNPKKWAKIHTSTCMYSYTHIYTLGSQRHHEPQEKGQKGHSIHVYINTYISTCIYNYLHVFIIIQTYTYLTVNDIKNPKKKGKKGKGKGGKKKK